MRAAMKFQTELRPALPLKSATVAASRAERIRLNRAMRVALMHPRRGIRLAPVRLRRPYLMQAAKASFIRIVRAAPMHSAKEFLKQAMIYAHKILTASRLMSRVREILRIYTL